MCGDVALGVVAKYGRWVVGPGGWLHRGWLHGGGGGFVTVVTRERP